LGTFLIGFANAGFASSKTTSFSEVFSHKTTTFDWQNQCWLRQLKNDFHQNKKIRT
jgi:hypothetical protein